MPIARLGLAAPAALEGPIPTHLAFLRAVNVGGTGKLAMAELRGLCEAVGLGAVRTYIQSGNVVLDSDRDPAEVAAVLEQAVAVHTGRRHLVVVRSPEQVAAALRANPFPALDPARVLVVLLDHAPLPEAVEGWPTPGGEQLALRGRELFVAFPDGMGRSRLKVPFADRGTGRNVRTLRAVLGWVGEGG